MKRCFLLLIVTTALTILSACTHMQTQFVDATTLLKSNEFAKLDGQYSALQRKYEKGSITEGNLRDAFRVFYPTDVALATKYDQWIGQFPKSYVAHLARAIYYRKVGEEKRGGAYIENTSEDQIVGMKEALARSWQDVEASLTLTGKPLLSYVQAIDMAGQLGIADSGRQFLDDAIKIAPDTLIARMKYMNNLETRWGGNVEAMRAFYAECETSHLSKSQLSVLGSMIAEEEGWLHVHVEKDAAAAQRDFDRADALSPGLFCSSCDRRELASLFMQQGNYSDAILVLSRSLQSEPNDSALLRNRGIAYMRTGKAREAIEDWTKAGSNGDTFSENELGRAYMMGIPGVLDKNSKSGIEWFAKAAAGGDAAAQKNLAIANAMQPPGP